MNVLHERCGGLDVHKETVVACRRVMAGAQVVREVRSFPTTTRGLLALADWLRAAGCTHVAMEATGVYWKPVWHVLEGEFELVLGPMRRTLRTSLDARATSTMPPGSQSCWHMG
jgi:transposase